MIRCAVTILISSAAICGGCYPINGASTNPPPNCWLREDIVHAGDEAVLFYRSWKAEPPVYLEDMPQETLGYSYFNEDGESGHIRFHVSDDLQTGDYHVYLLMDGSPVYFDSLRIVEPEDKTL
jgi:hypothetical protein